VGRLQLHVQMIETDVGEIGAPHDSVRGKPCVREPPRESPEEDRRLQAGKRSADTVVRPMTEGDAPLTIGGTRGRGALPRGMLRVTEQVLADQRYQDEAPGAHLVTRELAANASFPRFVFPRLERSLDQPHQPRRRGRQQELA
jgi:hypothetical protein